MTGPESTQSVVPDRKELSDAISFVLKDLRGPVDAAVVAKKIKAERPAWILRERRLKKLTKRFIKERENNPPKINNRYTPTDMNSPPIKFSSPSRSISSKTDTTVTSPYSIEELDLVEEGHSERQETKSNPVGEKNLNIKSVYEADNEDNDSSDDCCVACAIM